MAMEFSAGRHRNATSLRSWFGILQLEKAIFLIVNLMDVGMTMVLLNTGSFYESNPVADLVIDNWGLAGMALFKLSIVGSVLLIANVIAMKRIGTARGLLLVGTVMVSIVVAYSVMLLMNFEGV